MTQEYKPLSEAEIDGIDRALKNYSGPDKETWAVGVVRHDVYRLIATIRDLQGQVSLRDEALAFYADAANFEVAMFDTIYETTKQGRADFGTRAKQALEGKQEG